VSVCVYVSDLSLSPSVSLAVCLCVCVSVCLSVCLFVCLPACLPACLSFGWYVRKVYCGKTADWIRMPFGMEVITASDNTNRKWYSYTAYLIAAIVMTLSFLEGNPLLQTFSSAIFCTFGYISIYFCCCMYVWYVQTRSHPEMVGNMSRATLNFDLSKIPFVLF